MVDHPGRQAVGSTASSDSISIPHPRLWGWLPVELARKLQVLHEAQTRTDTRLVTLKEARHKLSRVSQDRQRVILAVRQLCRELNGLAS
jgi:hypothetical protein